MRHSWEVEFDKKKEFWTARLVYGWLIEHELYSFNYLKAIALLLYLKIKLQSLARSEICCLNKFNYLHTCKRFGRICSKGDK